MLVVAALCTASLLIMAVTWLQGLPIGGILFVPYLLVVVGSGGIIIAYRFYRAGRTAGAMSVSVAIIVATVWCACVIYTSEDRTPWLRTYGAYRAAQWHTTSPLHHLPQEYFLYSEIDVPRGFREVRHYDGTAGAVRVYEKIGTKEYFTIVVIETPIHANDDMLMMYPLYTFQWDNVRGGVRSIAYRNHDLERNECWA